MAFTAYIFKDDFNKLAAEEASLCHSQKGGSLFGQYTVDGNPVVYFVVYLTFSQYERDKIGKDLYDKFRICQIGEWRPAPSHGGYDFHEMKAREDLCRRAGFPARFLVLDVSRAHIVPFFFERQTPKGSGNLEILLGNSPFDKKDTFLAANYNNQQQYSQQAGAVVQVAARSVPLFQEAITTKSQWYASDKGSMYLQKVLEDLKKIAQGGNVAMSRDTRTQDITMSFNDFTSRRRKWEVRFPFDFPGGGALLIENPGTPREKEYKQVGSDKASIVVNNIKKYIV